MSLAISETDGSFKLAVDSKKAEKKPNSDSPPRYTSQSAGKDYNPGDGVKEAGEKLCRFIDSKRVLDPRDGSRGPSSSSLLTSLISSPTFRNDLVGLCSLSCVVFCERSSIIPSSPSSFPQREDFIYSLQRYDRAIQIGSQITN